MEQENRKTDRKSFSEEINFESMLTGENRRGIVYRSGSSTDISSVGLGLITPYKTAEGEILKLQIPFRALDITVPVFAEVKWVSPFEQDYKAGLRFLG